VVCDGRWVGIHGQAWKTKTIKRKTRTESYLGKLESAEPGKWNIRWHFWKFKKCQSSGHAIELTGRSPHNPADRYFDVTYIRPYTLSSLRYQSIVFVHPLEFVLNILVVRRGFNTCPIHSLSDDDSSSVRPVWLSAFTAVVLSTRRAVAHSVIIAYVTRVVWRFPSEKILLCDSVVFVFVLNFSSFK